MPDTGAPWNIPYVEAADLVSDWPADSLALANAIDAGLDEAALIKQVVQTVKTDTFSTSSTSLVDVTGLSVTITPTSATSKILVSYDVVGGNSAATLGFTVQLVRDSTAIYQSTDGTDGQSSQHVRDVGDNLTTYISSGIFLDSPATASAVTYKIQMAAVGASTAYVNRHGGATFVGNVSHITVIEVAA